MKKTIIETFALLSFTLIMFACSGDDTPYNPYNHQSKEPFYPSEILIGKSSSKRNIEEKWTFEYTGRNNDTIRRYTHSTVTRITNNGFTETTTEQEEGTLSYPNKFLVQNKINYTKKVEGFENTNEEKQIIIERAKCGYGKIESIERVIDYIDENGGVIKSATSSRSFSYTGDHCTASTYTDENGKQTTYTYNWDSRHRLNSVVVDDKSDNTRVNRTYNYSYGPVGKNYGFDINTFIYDNMPHVYSAMGFFGDASPYVIDEERQDFRILFEGRWEKDNSSDRKIFTTTEYTNEIKTDIMSDIYRNNYYIKFVK